MTEETLKPLSDTPKPATVDKDAQGETHPVDTKVQEEAAKERAESGGYD